VPAAVLFIQPPPCITYRLSRYDPPCNIDPASSSVCNHANNLIATEQSYSLAQQSLDMSEESTVLNRRGRKYTSRINNGTPDNHTLLGSSLEEWYNLHRESPYPTLEEKVQLAGASGKSVKQVGTWFSNKRTRDKEGMFDICAGKIIPVIPRHTSQLGIIPRTCHTKPPTKTIRRHSSHLRWLSIQSIDHHPRSIDQPALCLKAGGKENAALSIRAQAARYYPLQ
jgi:hypothetical protein